MSIAGSERNQSWIVVAALAAALAIAAFLPGSASAANSLGVHGSVNQVYVTGAQPGTSLRLLDRKGKKIATKPVGSLGGVIFRRVAAGKGYRVRAADGSRSVRVGVMSDRAAPKNQSIYNQTLPAGGYGYMTTRDGTSLSLDVRLPGPASDGPYPTLVEYSGYGYANPAGAESGISQILNLLGYRGRRREHARHRLLGRRLRLLREAPEPRRLRRGGDRRPPAVGRSTTGSVWPVSPTAGSASSSSAPPGRRTWPRSPRCR